MTDFATLVETESRGLLAAVTAIVGDRHRAEEIVQDAFERCYRRWSRVSKLDRPGAWARRVAINRAISVSRRASSERRAMERVGSRERSDVDASFDPLAALDDDGIWSAVRALPRDQAAAIALRYAADLGVDEIAETMHLTVPAVKSLLHRARTALRSAPAMQSYTE
jgi:RNA polymerase sigma factor (sigma-70 family)